MPFIHLLCLSLKVCQFLHHQNSKCGFQKKRKIGRKKKRDKINQYQWRASCVALRTICHVHLTTIGIVVRELISCQSMYKWRRLHTSISFYFRGWSLAFGFLPVSLFHSLSFVLFFLNHVSYTIVVDQTSPHEFNNKRAPSFS